jgi:hypothetical protein
VIARRFFLFVGRIVLLVDDDEAEPSERSEHGGPRADDEIHIAAADPMPLIVAFAVRERTVLDSHAFAEGAAKQRGDRWRQCDFRNQQQNLTTCALDRLR